jgi:hypothetical protein
MNIKIFVGILTILISWQANAQMPVQFDFSMQIDKEPSHFKSEGSVDCLLSAKALIPNEQLRAKFQENLTCNAVDPKAMGGIINNAMCATPNVSDHKQYIAFGSFDLVTGKFWLAEREYLSASKDPKSRTWFQINSGQKGKRNGSFEIRGISQNEWQLSMLSNLSVVDIQSECKIILPTQNTFR